MICKKIMEKLHTNQRLLIEEFQKRKINCTLLSKDMELVETNFRNHWEFILDRDSSVTPYPASIVSGDKFLTKQLLKRSGISVVEGMKFFHDQMDGALQYAQKIGYPLVVKPTFGSHGTDVHMDLNNLVAVKRAIEEVIASIGKDKSFIVEQQFEGKEFRVFITKKGDYAVLHRDPAHVIGDGVNNIRNLVNIENAKRAKHKSCLCPLLVDKEALTFMTSRGYSLDYCPKKYEKVYLRHNSNVAMGATCIDYTQKIHKSVIAISKKALRTMHQMPYAGVDFLTKDVNKVQSKDSYRILELNSIPGIHMHMNPSSGKGRNISKWIADMIYPETRKR
jgi:cyanophycin synthetase